MLYPLYGPEARRYFLIIFSMWLPQSSIDGHSKRFSSSDLGNSKIINCKCWGNCYSVLSLCLDPININSVLVIFRVSLFVLSQLWTFSKSSFKLVWILWILLLAYVRWVSSAYIRDSQFDRQLGRSLIYDRNNNGPKIVPSGTPQLKKQPLERPLVEHICVRSSKYDWNRWCAIPLYILYYYCL